MISAAHRLAAAQQGGRTRLAPSHQLKLLQVWQGWDLDTVLGLCHALGFTGILVKALDGTSWMSNFDDSSSALGSLEELQQQVTRTRSEGLYYFAWTNPLVQTTNDRAFEATLTGQIARSCDGLFLDVEPYCHSQDTEVLTEAGWQPFSAWSGTPVATVSPTGVMEFQQPSQFHAFAHDGPMVHFAGQHGLDVLVTPNHDMLAARHIGHSRALHFAKVRASQVSAEARLLVAPTSWTGEEALTMQVPLVEYEPSGRHRNLSRHARALPPIAMDDWLEFLGYFIAEGYVRAAKTPPYEFGLVQKRGAVADRIAACLARLPLGFDHHMDGDKHRWRASNKSAWTYLRDHVGQGANNKRIPRALLGCSQRQLHILMDALVEGDGSGPTPSGRRAYYSISRGLLNDVQELALRLGYRAHISGGTVLMTERTTAVAIAPREVPYCGMVYCFTVPNGVLVTRRNGNPCVSGNSQFWGSNVPVGVADQFMRWVRLEAPNAFLALQPDPRENALQAIRVDEWLPYVDVLAGQHYWSDFGTKPSTELLRALEMGQRYGLPVLPTLPGNAPLGGFPLEQIALLPGFVVWRYGSTPQDTLATLGGSSVSGLVSSRIPART